MTEYDFINFDYHDGTCLHRQGIPIHTIVRTSKGLAPDLRCKAGKEGCGRPLSNVTQIRPHRRSSPMAVRKVY